MKKTKKASVLIVSLVVMGVILIIALSVSLTSIRSKKEALDASKSSRAYHAAEIGIENVMKSLTALNRTDDQLSEITDWDCNNPVAPDRYAYTEDTAGGYKVEFKGLNGGSTTCADRISKIASVKSTGSDTGNNEQRAIEAAMAAGLTWHPISLETTDGWDSASSSYYAPAWAYDPVRGLIYLRGEVTNTDPGADTGSGHCIFNDSELGTIISKAVRFSSVLPNDGISKPVPIALHLTSGGCLYIEGIGIGDGGVAPTTPVKTGAVGIPLDGIVFSQ